MRIRCARRACARLCRAGKRVLIGNAARRHRRGRGLAAVTQC